MDELFVSYVKPQENGNRTDVQWVALAEPRGRGLLACGAPLLNFSALRYSRKSLEEAKHPCDLRRAESLLVSLDHAHTGLGSASCGPGPLPAYLLQPEEMRFRFRLVPFSLDAVSPMALYRRPPEECG